MEIIDWYFSVGFAIYIVAAAANYEQLREADAKSLMRGLVGIIAWPVVIYKYAKGEM